MKATLPVSKKFYTDITARVTNALSFSPSSIVEAMRIIDLYLDGQTVASSDTAAMLAFNMIRDEIDRALTRSQRARRRAALNRELKKMSGEKALSPEAPVEADEPESQAESVTSRHISRRARRAMSRAMIKRQGGKWKPIQSPRR